MTERLEHGVSGAVRAAWAKSWPFVGGVEQWLPLDQHLADSTDVAGLLWDDWLADSVRSLVASAVGDACTARRLVRFLAGVHDVGKASPAFAVQVPRLADRMVRSGLRFGASVTNDRTALRHEVASAAVIERRLAQCTSLSSSMREQLSVVAAGHHGAYPPRSAVAVSRLDLLGEGLWVDVQHLLVDRALRRSELRWSELDGRVLPVAVQAALTAIVIMADWIASDEFCFPLLPVDVLPELDEPRVSESGRAVEGWRRAGLPRRWTAPSSDVSIENLFARRFPNLGTPPRSVQRAVVRAASDMAVPGLLMVEAPMGSGKTEAALLAAELLAARSGASGIFVALPTQATSSAMFSRVHDYLQHVPSGTEPRHTLALVHGKAALNEEASGLPSIRARTVLDEEPREHRGRLRPLVPVAEAWARGRKRAALAQFVVGTIDQVLFSALLARHVVIRQLSLIGNVVVIDEVHAADTYMAVYLDRALAWLASCGTPVVMLSATLPAERRRALYDAYESGRAGSLGVGAVADSECLGGDIGYPALVATGVAGPVVAVEEAGLSSDVAVRRVDDDLGSLVAELRGALRHGGCAAVVRNTVARAQETAAALEAEFGSEAVLLVHSRFLDVDRRAHDRRLLAELGPRGERPALRIVVGTQVLEQSLDIDFDLMVTDLAPVDLMFQRIGRLHRHAGRPRPVGVALARCLVTGAEWKGPVPVPVTGSVRVYGALPLLAAAHVLDAQLDGEPLRLPVDIARLVQDAYRPDLPPPAGWEAAWEEARRANRKVAAAQRKKAATYLLDPPEGRSLFGAFRGGVGNIDEDSPEGQACVRDSGDSVEVVVVVCGRDGIDRLVPWLADVALPLRHVPLADGVARLVAQCTVRLPPAMVLDPAVARRVIEHLERDRFEGWDATPLLRRQLALVLDDDLAADVAGFTVTYDRRQGLTALAQAPP
ncbi:CRISPR-associated helicase/endonuclease Cas3 [Cellulomonas uda]|uniref:CRISPR-associated helicase/endonuclease Cas3 n=2 Tax=Cellulomonas uda TaxID=1714 RepID=A0A4Y3KFF3_CELUD|nr:CRISPR-associated helicase Cas3' [Cellulomonas uda]GEA81728.1 CRISPR-associated helicase/endonuclease Cas3 [Cellulomonas uda]